MPAAAAAKRAFASCMVMAPEPAACWKLSAKLHTASTIACARSVRSATSSARAISRQVTDSNTMNRTLAAVMNASLAAIDPCVTVSSSFAIVGPLMVGAHGATAGQHHAPGVT